jgi:tetratricopeptide (TPR) repeat protein
MSVLAVRASRGVICSALCIFTAACSSFFVTGEPVDIKPVHTAAPDTPLLSDEGVYQDAVREMKSRDYGSALDFLQVARIRSPDDVRVFNALGVIYDKLGRFDLSARYYAAAMALAPDSKIVQNNITYSATLQKALRAEQQGQPATTAAIEEKTPLPRFPQAPDDASKTVSAAMTAEETPPPPAGEIANVIPPGARASSGLSILDASQSDAGSRLLGTIERQGWTMPAKAFGSLPQRPSTTISYARADIAVAMSLASALPIPSRLEICEEGCHGIVVIVGADAREDNASKLQIAEAGPTAEQQ